MSLSQSLLLQKRRCDTTDATPQCDTIVKRPKLQHAWEECIKSDSDEPLWKNLKTNEITVNNPIDTTEDGETTDEEIIDCAPAHESKSDEQKPKDDPFLFTDDDEVQASKCGCCGHNLPEDGAKREERPIHCDNQHNCKRGGWFHLKCVGKKNMPSGEKLWYCDECKKTFHRPSPITKRTPTPKKASPVIKMDMSTKVDNIHNLMVCVQAFWTEERKVLEDKLIKMTAERDALQEKINKLNE